MVLGAAALINFMLLGVIYSVGIPLLIFFVLEDLCFEIWVYDLVVGIDIDGTAETSRKCDGGQLIEQLWAAGTRVSSVSTGNPALYVRASISGRVYAPRRWFRSLAWCRRVGRLPLLRQDRRRSGQRYSAKLARVGVVDCESGQ